MFTKLLLGLALMGGLAAAPFALAAFNGPQAPCSCCGDACTCEVCTCDANGCACLDGGKCECTPACCATCCAE
jgi:hypothetical protein